MVLSFKEKFVPLIMAGTKIHTIRADEKDRWKAGKKIHFATGARSKDYYCFKEGVCLATEKIFINSAKRIISIEGIGLSETSMYWLAVNDGFKTTRELLSFFPEPFTGKIIHWKENTYTQTHEPCPACGARKNKKHSMCENTACWHEDKKEKK